MPIILADPAQNVFIQSPVGTGKTIALVTAMLSRVDTNKKYPHVLGIVANHEAAMKMIDLLESIGKYSKAKFETIVSGAQCEFFKFQIHIQAIQSK